MSKALPKEVQTLLADWTNDANGCRKGFEFLLKALEGQGKLTFSFKGRPSISYSLRVTHEAQKERKLFTLIDIIDDDPNDRWLSVCFYDDMITDPEDLGDFVPGGLMGEDAHCLNMDEWDETLANYIATRIKEAAASAAAGK